MLQRLRTLALAAVLGYLLGTLLTNLQGCRWPGVDQHEHSGHAVGGTNN